MKTIAESETFFKFIINILIYAINMDINCIMLFYLSAVHLYQYFYNVNFLFSLYLIYIFNISSYVIILS